MGLRETLTRQRDRYALPGRAGVAARMWIVMVLASLLALALWLALPGSPVTVAVTAIALLGLIGGGVAVALSSREASEPPGRHPTQPPSTRPPTE